MAKSDGQTGKQRRIDLTGSSAQNARQKLVEVSEGKVRITDEGTYTLLQEHWKKALSLIQVMPNKSELISKNAKLTA